MPDRDGAEAAARSRREDASLEARRLADQFLACLNHGIRTPLTGIMGMVDLLVETPLSPEQSEYVETLRLCAGELLEMLNSALDYTALQAGELTLEKAEFNLPEALAAFTAEYRPRAAAKGLSLTCRLDQRLPAVAVGDAHRIRQMLAPLLSNAIKFTHQGGIEVSATLEETAPDSGRLLIRIADTGMGIPEESLETIFEAFRTLEGGLARSRNGLGLGLAIARRLATLMGGEIRVTSQPGRGSTFEVSVPIERPGAEPSDKGETAQPRPAQILLVEDNEVARRVLTHMLRRGGYQVECATGGRQGIEAAAARRYDLILMDIQMPEVDGLAATFAIRELEGYAETPIVAVTANYSEEFKRACQQAGFAEFLAKPVEAEQLLAAVARLLPKRR